MKILVLAAVLSTLLVSNTPPTEVSRKPLCALPLLPDYPYGDPLKFASQQLGVILEREAPSDDQVGLVLSRERSWSHILRRIFFQPDSSTTYNATLPSEFFAQNDPRLRSKISETDGAVLSRLLQFHTYAVIKLLRSRQAFVKDLFPRANLEIIQGILAHVDTDLTSMRLEIDPAAKPPLVSASAGMIRALYYFALKSHVDLAKREAVQGFYKALTERSRQSADVLRETLSGKFIDQREPGHEGWTNQVVCGCSRITNKITGETHYVVGMSAITAAKEGGDGILLTGILPEDISSSAEGLDAVGPPRNRGLVGTIRKGGREIAVTEISERKGEMSPLHVNFYLMARMVAILWFQLGHELGHVALGNDATEAECDAFGVLPFEIAQGPMYYVAATVYDERKGIPPFPPPPVTLVYAPFRFAQPTSPAAGSLHDVWGSIPVPKGATHGTWLDREKNVGRFSGKLYRYWLSHPNLFK